MLYLVDVTVDYPAAMTQAELFSIWTQELVFPSNVKMVGRRRLCIYQVESASRVEERRWLPGA